ncbi:hypothetical protein LCGC14_2321530 [marine sediment metagenome]|uniref:Uncharacterized protein n=1 Tax=marine sediment metagenome TaxID=412755 RepID=A0A0F9CI92_9ZZZZ
MVVNYPNLDNFSGDIVELLKLPNSSFPFYWSIIIVTIGIIVALTLYFKEKETTTKGNLLSAMAVSSFAMIILSTLAVLIGLLTLETFLPLLIGGLVIIAIWIFS